MRKTAAKWSQLSGEMQSLSAESKKESDFGLVKNAEPSHNELSGAASQWSSGASTEFDGFRGKLGNAAGAFEANEASAAQIAGQMNNG